ncbi:MAG: hypothetical protein HUJ53_00680 [Holdemanella sp.]|nr:hypothetical protein [Holdemanella sp.]
MKKTLTSLLAASMALQFAALPVVAEEQDPVIVEETIQAEEQVEIEVYQEGPYWALENGRWRYYTNPGEYYINAEVEIKGKWYCFDEAGYMVTGWTMIPGVWKYYDKTSGARVTGLQTINGKLYFFNSYQSDMMANSASIVVGDKLYYFGEDGAAIKGFMKVNQFTYYYGNDCARATGWQKIDGTWYYFNEGANIYSEYYAYMFQNTAMTTATTTYWFDKDGRWVESGWIQFEDGWRYIKNGELYAGWVQSGNYSYYLDPDNNYIMAHNTKKTLIVDGVEKDCYFDGNGHYIKNGWYDRDGDGKAMMYLKDGNFCQGFHTIDGYPYYFDVDYICLKDQIKDVGDIFYYIDKDGHIIYNGWVEIQGIWYYLENGEPKTGFLDYKGYTYYLYPEMAVSMIVYEDGKFYYTDDQGHVVKSGWVYANYDWFYLENGKPKTGWLQYKGVWYYLDPNAEADGRMDYDCTIEDGGKYYYLDENGHMVTGWNKRDDKWYLYNASGAQVFGWYKENGYWYYLNENRNGAMLSETMFYDNDYQKMYLFDKDGHMVTGWYKSTIGKWYLCKSDGEVVFGWATINGTTYYLDPNVGEMYSDRIYEDANHNRYYFDASGAMAKNKWVRRGYRWYYYDENGKEVSGWKYINGNYYYFKKDNDNAMAANEMLILDDPVTGESCGFFFDGNGHYQKAKG